MAMIDGRPAQYGISLKHLRELMELRGREGIAKLNEYGGVQELCKKLYTSPSEGKYIAFSHLSLPRPRPRPPASPPAAIRSRSRSRSHCHRLQV